MKIHTIGIDLGKTKFHIVGLNERGEVVVRKQFSRAQLLRFTANRKVHLIGMEACGGSHFLARLLQRQGHEVRLMPAQYVKPYVKTNKSDYIDAEAIAEAVGRPTMRFVQRTALYRSCVTWDSGRRGCETVGSIALTAGATEVGAGPDGQTLGGGRCADRANRA